MSRLAALAAVLAFAATLPAAAQTIDRVRVAEAGAPLTSGFARTVFVTLAPPPEYSRAAAGRWVGPRYQATGDGTVGGPTSLSWTLRFGEGGDPAAAANALLTHGWPLDIRGGVSVPHVVRGRTVGTILGRYVLTRAPGADSARYEATVAFPLAPRVLALLRLEAAEPESESAGDAGRYLVNGAVPVAVWNRGQTLWALTAVRVEGSLQPTRVSAQAAGGASVVRGAVADAFRHPVAGARVQLQRRDGGRWSRVAATRTNAAGRYRIRGVLQRGVYRTVATLGAAAARSRPVVAGR